MQKTCASKEIMSEIENSTMRPGHLESVVTKPPTIQLARQAPSCNPINLVSEINNGIGVEFLGNNC